VPVGGAEHEQRPAEAGGKPEQAADPDAEEPENTPGAVMQPDFELERAPRRPADRCRRLVGEEDLGNETHRQADHADAEHQGVEQQDMNDALRRPRHLAERQVQQRQNDHQNCDEQGDH
jgi:hypothetical protein